MRMCVLCVCVYAVYAFMYAYVCVCVRVCTSTSVRVCEWMCVRVYVCVSMNSCVRVTRSQEYKHSVRYACLRDLLAQEVHSHGLHLGEQHGNNLLGKE